MKELQNELLVGKPDELSDTHYHDLCKDVEETLSKLNIDCQKLKVVHQKLNEIEQVKNEISEWSAHVKHDINGGGDKDSPRKVLYYFVFIG